MTCRSRRHSLNAARGHDSYQRDYWPQRFVCRFAKSTPDNDAFRRRRCRRYDLFVSSGRALPTRYQMASPPTGIAVAPSGIIVAPAMKAMPVLAVRNIHFMRLAATASFEALLHIAPATDATVGPSRSGLRQYRREYLFTAQCRRYRCRSRVASLSMVLSSPAAGVERGACICSIS